jgi:hypothetical protein
MNSRKKMPLSVNRAATNQKTGIKERIKGNRARAL